MPEVKETKRKAMKLETKSDESWATDCLLYVCEYAGEWVRVSVTDFSIRLS